MKLKQTAEQKARKFIEKYPAEFTLSNTRELFCKVCSCVVNCDKAHYVETHRTTIKHGNANSILAKQPKIAADSERKGKTFTERVTEAFLSADIPLKKISNPSIKALFSSMNHPLPSESSCRNAVERIHSKMIDEIKSFVFRKIR